MTDKTVTSEPKKNLPEQGEGIERSDSEEYHSKERENSVDTKKDEFAEENSDDDLTT